MDILDRCRELLNEIESCDERLHFVEKELLDDSKDYTERIALYEEEFHLCIQIQGAAEDLDKYLDKLKGEEGMVFMANRFRKRADDILKGDKHGFSTK
jgi:hypothetical protein